MVVNKKIKLKDICAHLKNNPHKKSAYFRMIKDPRFLKPLFKEGLFSFNDDSSYFFCSYLQEILNNSQEHNEEVISVINQCINSCQVNQISFNTYLSLVDIIDSFHNEDFFKLELRKLFFSYYSIYLIKKYLNKIQFCSDEKRINKDLRYICYALFKKRKNQGKVVLSKDIFFHNRTVFLSLLSPISSLLKIKHDNSDDISFLQLLHLYLNNPYAFVIKHNLNKEEIDLLLFFKKIFENSNNSETFFRYLKKKFYNAYNNIYAKHNAFIELYSRQFIDFETLFKDLGNDKKSNYLDIVEFFLIILLAYPKNNYHFYFQELFNDEHFYLRKIGLYLVLSNVRKGNSQFFEYLEIFFNKVSSINILPVCFFCAYELIHIFILWSKYCNSNKTTDSLICKINSNIHTFLDRITDDNYKFRLLHGLKNHPEFSYEFSILKEKYGFELHEPDVFYKQYSGLVTHVPPKEVKDLTDIKELVTYFNSNIEYKNNLKNNGHGGFDEECEEGLVSYFKDLLNKNISVYLDDKNIFCLKKSSFIKALFESIGDNLSTMKDPMAALRIIDYYLKSDSRLSIEVYRSVASVIYSISKLCDKNEMFSDYSYVEWVCSKTYDILKLELNDNYELFDLSKKTVNDLDNEEICLLKQHVDNPLNSLYGYLLFCFFCYLKKISNLDESKRLFVNNVIKLFFVTGKDLSELYSKNNVWFYQRGLFFFFLGECIFQLVPDVRSIIEDFFLKETTPFFFCFWRGFLEFSNKEYYPDFIFKFHKELLIFYNYIGSDYIIKENYLLLLLSLLCENPTDSVKKSTVEFIVSLSKESYDIVLDLISRYPLFYKNSSEEIINIWKKGAYKCDPLLLLYVVGEVMEYDFIFSNENDIKRIIDRIAYGNAFDYRFISFLNKLKESIYYSRNKSGVTCIFNILNSLINNFTESITFDFSFFSDDIINNLTSIFKTMNEFGNKRYVNTLLKKIEESSCLCVYLKDITDGLKRES